MKILKSQSGSYSVMAILFLSALVTFAAFVIEIGHLYATRNTYQNALEAAARAGAADMCGDPVQTARDIAIANGVPDTEGLTVQLGFYDELGMYDDFDVYKDFKADSDPVDTPFINEDVMKNSDGQPHYNNAVLASYEAAENSATGLFTDTVKKRVVAMAYLVRYGIIVLGDDGLAINKKWINGNPIFKDASVHGNGDLTFNASSEFQGDTIVSAVGNINNCSGYIIDNADELKIEPLEDKLDDLMEIAQSQGNLYITTEWHINNNSADFQKESFGKYNRDSEKKVWISLADGDHDGAVYFFKSSNTGSSSTVELINIESNDEKNADNKAWNFTIVTDIPSLNLQMQPSETPVTLGDSMNKTEIYAVGTINYNDDPRLYVINGVLFRTNNFISNWNQRETSVSNKMRIIAEQITFNGSKYPAFPADMIIDSTFGPPCPPNIVKLGLIVPVE